jgi:hypothetical protein
LQRDRRREPNLQKLQRTSNKPSSHQLARYHLLAATAGQAERSLLRAARRAEAALEKGVAGAPPPQPLQPHDATAVRKEIGRGSRRNTALLGAAHTRRSKQTPAAPKSTPPSPVHLHPLATKAGQRETEQSKDGEEEEAADGHNLIQRSGGHRRHAQLPPEKLGHAADEP